MSESENCSEAAPSTDVVDDSVRRPFATQESRQKFITKVFTVVGIMLSAIALGAFFPLMFPGPEYCEKDGNTYVCTAAHPVRQFFIDWWFLLFIPMISWMVTYFMLMCINAVRMQTPCNLITLSIFSVSAALMMPFITASSTLFGIAIAFIVTAALALAIIIMAKFTSIDFTSCGFLIWIVSIGVILFALLCGVFLAVARPGFTVSLIVHLIISFLFIILYCWYLAHSVQLVLGGRRYQITEDQWVLGAVIIFVDIFSLFLTMIGLTGRA